MSFRFTKKIAPGIRLSASPKGPAISGRLGVPGAGVSVSSRGRVTGSVGAGGARWQKSKALSGSGAAAPVQDAPTAPDTYYRDEIATIIARLSPQGQGALWHNFHVDPAATAADFGMQAFRQGRADMLDLVAAFEVYMAEWVASAN